VEPLQWYPVPRARAATLARRKGVEIRLCEAEPGERLPRYSERRELLETIGSAAIASITVFTDATRSAYVWAWKGGGASVKYTEEYRVPGREGALATAIESLLGGGGGMGQASEAWTAEDRLLEALGGPHDSPAADGGLGGTVERLTAQSTGADLLRSWRRLRTITILDPCCGEGAWLLGAVAPLFTLRQALLCRIRSWVDDEPGLRGGAQSPSLEKLRAIVATTEDRERFDSPSAYLLRAIVLDNLLGAEVDRRAAIRCRARLRELCGPGGYGGCEPNIRWGRFTGLTLPGAAVRRMLASGRSPEDQGPLEELEALRFTMKTLRETRIDRSAPEWELARAEAEAARRMRRLRRQLADRESQRPARLSGRWRRTLTAPPQLLHPGLEYPWGVPGHGLVRSPGG
jgi:hypothetical protein